MNRIIANSDVKQKAQRYKTVFYEAMNDDMIRSEMMMMLFISWQEQEACLVRMQHNESRGRALAGTRVSSLLHCTNDPLPRWRRCESTLHAGSVAETGATRKEALLLPVSAAVLHGKSWNTSRFSTKT